MSVFHLIVYQISSPEHGHRNDEATATTATTTTTTAETTAAETTENCWISRDSGVIHSLRVVAGNMMYYWSIVTSFIRCWHVIGRLLRHWFDADMAHCYPMDLVFPVCCSEWHEIYFHLFFFALLVFISRFLHFFIFSTLLWHWNIYFSIFRHFYSVSCQTLLLLCNL